MDAETKRAVTDALDSAIAKVAEEEFERLSEGLGKEEIAQRIDGALQSMRGLRADIKPGYDAWDALFYVLWYQPGQINLAYSLTQQLPQAANPLVTGRGRLKVVDFGCGALAMRFGLHLACVDSLQDHRTVPEITMEEHDESEDMKRLGQSVTQQFSGRFGEIAKTISETGWGKSSEGPSATWVTALHVSYQENTTEVAGQIGSLIESDDPDLVLVTKNRNAPAPLYQPNQALYDEASLAGDVGDGLLAEGDIVLRGVTGFRRQLREEYPSLDEAWALQSDTTWTRNVQNSVNRCYVRRER